MGKTKELYTELQDELINQSNLVENGEISFLDALIYMEEERRYLEDSLAIIKEFKADNLDDISNEASEFKDGYRGYKFEIRSGGRMFNFKHIPEWQTYDSGKKDCEARYKAMLDAKLKGSTFANVTEDGEELPLPKITYRKSSLIIKKQK